MNHCPRVPDGEPELRREFRRTLIRTGGERALGNEFPNADHELHWIGELRIYFGVGDFLQTPAAHGDANAFAAE